MRHNWEYKKLGEVAEIIGGSTPKTNVKEYWDGDYFWITPAELKGDRFIKSTSRTITDLAVENTNLSLLPKGTVLLSSRAPIGKVAIADVPMYCNQGFKNIICGEKLNNNYIYWLLYGKTEYLNSLGVGATFKEISKKIVENIIIPVPPLPTQQAIVSELDTLSGIIAECKETLKDYDALEQSIFYDMFGDPVKNEKGWEVKKLGEICDVITKGTTPTTVGFQFLNEGINFVKVESFEEGKLNKTKFAYISDECHEALRRSQLLENDILICIAGATVGKLALVTKDILPANTNQACCIIRLKKEFAVSRKYIFSILQSDYIKRFIESLKKGVAQPNLTLEHVRNFSIPNVPINLQQTFASKIEAIEQMKEETKKALQEAETLFQTRMDYWFN